MYPSPRCNNDQLISHPCPELFWSKSRTYHFAHNYFSTTLHSFFLHTSAQTFPFYLLHICKFSLTLQDSAWISLPTLFSLNLSLSHMSPWTSLLLSCGSSPLESYTHSVIGLESGKPLSPHIQCNNKCLAEKGLKSNDLVVSSLLKFGTTISHSTLIKFLTREVPHGIEQGRLTQ